ncbi:MAG TPA: helix-turn-helix transcriptional regulator [Thermoanaerobaculia bacterium]|nr:helix-turn-helix transcriptional regulator [Thermoanaerobaculia bacterium]
MNRENNVQSQLKLDTARRKAADERAAFRREVGFRIARARKKLGLRQPELGEAAGCPSYMISRYETGQILPRTLTLIRLAAALGVTVDSLLASDEHAGWPAQERR